MMGLNPSESDQYEHYYMNAFYKTATVLICILDCKRVNIRARNIWETHYFQALDEGSRSYACKDLANLGAKCKSSITLLFCHAECAFFKIKVKFLSFDAP